MRRESRKKLAGFWRLSCDRFINKCIRFKNMKTTYKIGEPVKVLIPFTYGEIIGVFQIPIPVAEGDKRPSTYKGGGVEIDYMEPVNAIGGITEGSVYANDDTMFSKAYKKIDIIEEIAMLRRKRKSSKTIHGMSIDKAINFLEKFEKKTSTSTDMVA